MQETASASPAASLLLVDDDQPVASTSNSEMNDSRRMEFLDDDEIQSITNSSWLKTSHLKMAMGLLRQQFPDIGALFNIQCCVDGVYPPSTEVDASHLQRR